MAQQAQSNHAQQAEMAKLQEQNSFIAKTMAGKERDVATARARVSAALAAKTAATAGRRNKREPVGRDVQRP